MQRAFRSVAFNTQRSGFLNWPIWSHCPADLAQSPTVVKKPGVLDVITEVDRVTSRSAPADRLTFRRPCIDTHPDDFVAFPVRTLMEFDMVAPAARAPEWNDKDKAKIRKLFDQCDADKGGTVSLDELGRALASDKDLCRILGIDPIAAMPGNKAKLREVFEAVDIDGSDELDFDEFGLFFQSRVEILRYLPGTDDEDKFCIIQESI